MEHAAAQSLRHPGEHLSAVAGRYRDLIAGQHAGRGEARAIQHEIALQLCCRCGICPDHGERGVSPLDLTGDGRLV